MRLFAKKPKMDLNNIPNHVAFIMDGNGRWATKRGLPRTAGHKAGIEALRCVIQRATELGIKIISLYAFSTENWKRPVAEVEEIFNLLREYLNEDTSKLVEQGVKVVTMGDISKLPNDIREAIERCVKETKNCDKYTFNVGINYGGRPEIIRAVNNIITAGVKSVTEKEFSQYLYTANLPDPDFIVRTSGEMRLSNFMPYQSAYSEFYFPKTFWPDFREKELDIAVLEYQKRHRRYA